MLHPVLVRLLVNFRMAAMEAPAEMEVPAVPIPLVERHRDAQWFCGSPWGFILVMIRSIVL